METEGAGAETHAILHWTYLRGFCELSAQIYASIDRNHDKSDNIHLSTVLGQVANKKVMFFLTELRISEPS